MGDGIQERIAKNNFTFREANEQIRAKADILTVPGHEQADEPVGRVVDRRDGYVVVEKNLDHGSEER